MTKFYRFMLQQAARHGVRRVRILYGSARGGPVRTHRPRLVGDVDGTTIIVVLPLNLSDYPINYFNAIRDLQRAIAAARARSAVTTIGAAP